MPYSRHSGRLERARSIGHVPIVENPFIKTRLQGYRIFTPEPSSTVDSSLIVPADDLGTPGDPIRWVMSFDGSPQEVAAREAYPSTRIGYVQIAGVLVHLQEMLQQAGEHLVDPEVIRSTTQEALHSLVLPGSNVCRADMPTVRDSWRAEVFEIFRDYTVEDIPLLDVFMLLVQHSDKRATGGAALARCSADESCKARDISVPPQGRACPNCGKPLFPTDALRLHEEILEEHENLTSLGRLMSSLEQITMAAYLHFLAQRQPRVLGSVGFILDGPLAVFGPQAWLHTAIGAFINGLTDSLTKQHLKGPVIVGIEKSGQFAEHVAAIQEGIPRRAIMMLPDKYIYEHILTFRLPPNSSFGRDTYYGQKFFYKTVNGQVLTITIPKAPSEANDGHRPTHYPLLPDTLALLDRIGTALYKDAVIPIALAHSFASIPLRTGSKVLKLLSREVLGLSDGKR